MYNRESKIVRKLLGKAAPDSAASGDLSAIAGTTAPVPNSYRPSKSQDAVYSAGVPISCFDVSPDRRAVILGGPYILKTMLLDDPSSPNFFFHEGIDVRTAITTRPAAGHRSNLVSDQLNIRDVKWHGGSNIYTAGASGKVFSYDLTRLGAGDASEPFEYVLMHEDSRQMNSLDINPHLRTWLLTGGQDGTARVFDSKSPTPVRHGITFRQRYAPLRCIDSIRQVQWSPKAGHEMACCTESGLVMKWDVRQPSRPLLRINAHDKVCSTISWHPDGNHLASAGWDTKMHVWDLSSTADKRQKPKWSISTPAPVAAIAWRPGLWSATAQARRVAQIAVSYDESNVRRYGTSAVHIWDLARPSMPYKEIESFEACPSAIAWQDQDMLWSVGQDGGFNQRDVAFARRLTDRQSTSAMAFSSKGDTIMFLDERWSAQRPRMLAQGDAINRGTVSSSPGNQELSISRSDSEDDALGSFTGSRRRLTRRRRLSGRGAPLSAMLSTGGSSLTDEANQDLGLEQSVQVTGTYRPQQAMSFGHIPAARSAAMYQYLSGAYMDALRSDLPYVEGGKSLEERVCVILEKYSKAAETTRMYRLAQTWRVLAFGMKILLKRRAQYHLRIRAGQFQKLHIDDAAGRLDRLKMSEGTVGRDDSPKRTSGTRGSIDGRFHSVRSLLAEEIESTSNVPTPIARAVDSGNGDGSHGLEEPAHQHGRRLSPIVEPEVFSLGPAAQGPFGQSSVPHSAPRKRLDSEPISVRSQRTEETDSSHTDGYDFYDAAVLAKAIDVPVAKSHKNGMQPPHPGLAARHGSGESSAQMFSLSNGTGRSTQMGSSGDAFARPGLTREQSEVTSGASSAEFSAMSRTLAEQDDDAFRSSGEAEEVFMLSQTTQTNESSGSQPSFTEGEAPGLSPRQPVQIPGVEGAGRSAGTKKQSHTKKSSSEQHRYDTRPHIIESDFLPWADDAPWPYPLGSQESDGSRCTASSPLDPHKIVLRALDFECRSSALSASAMILLLKPLVPDGVIESQRAGAILRQQHQRLMRMGLFVEAALLRNLCVQGWPEGLPEWGENYTAIFGGAQQGVKVGLFCSACRKPREVDPAAGAAGVWTCERCRAVMAPCAICGHREAERAAHTPAAEMETTETSEPADGDDDDAWLSQWWYCPGCTHGGHASCLQLWHSSSSSSSSSSPAKYSDGCCPSDGCGHACLPGKYRSETTTARSDELGRAVVLAAAAAAAGDERGGGSRNSSRPASRAGSRRMSPAGADRDLLVRSDSNDVLQSKAVAMARDALNKGHGAGGGGSSGGGGSGGGGILSSSPNVGRMHVSSSSTGDRERRKSVKFARTEG